MKIESLLLLLIFFPLLWGLLRGQLRLGLRGMASSGLAASMTLLILQEREIAGLTAWEAALAVALVVAVVFLRRIQVQAREERAEAPHLSPPVASQMSQMSQTSVPSQPSPPLAPSAMAAPAVYPQKQVFGEGSEVWQAEVLELLRGGNKIQAIKVVRDATGLGLKEAKDYVESLPGGR